MGRYFFSLLIFLGFFSRSYSQNHQFEVIKLEDNSYYFSAIEIAPDGKTLALGTQSGHILLFDLSTKKILRDIPLTGYKHGPYVTYSTDGKYLLLVEQFFTNWRMNADLPSKAAVLDIATGKELVSESGVNYAQLTPDGRQFVYLKNDEIVFTDILTQKKDRSFKPDRCASSFAVCSENNLLAVAQYPDEKDLEAIPTLRNDKKAVKEALKYRQVAVFYDLKDFKRKFMANDIFDIIFGMKYNPEAGTLYLHNAPNYQLNKSSTTSARNGYIQPVDPSTGEVSRTMFATSIPEPIYKESPDGKYFAIISQEHRSTVINTVQVYNRQTGEMINVFKNDFRLFEDTHIGRGSFEFLPDHETMILGYGSKLALWKFLEKN